MENALSFARTLPEINSSHCLLPPSKYGPVVAVTLFGGNPVKPICA
jgi:hypothetical protein